MEKNVIKDLGKDIKKVLTASSIKINGKAYVDIDFAVEVFEAKLQSLSANTEDYSAKKYMEDEFDFTTDDLSADMIDTICHFAECFAKFYNFEIK